MKRKSFAAFGLVCLSWMMPGVLRAFTVSGPPSISEGFSPTSIPIKGISTLTFTISNPNTSGLTGVGFTDSLPAGLVVAAPNGFANSCGGTASATAGGTPISLAGGSVSASSSCTVAVNVTGSTTGSFVNNTSAVTSNEGGNGSGATATLSVAAPPSVSQRFQVNSIPLNASPGATLVFLISNPNNASLTGIGLTDSLPTGLVGAVVTAPGPQTSNCGGTLTGGTSITLTGGSLEPNGTCTVVANVTGTSPGVYTNTTSAVTSSGGTGNTTSASLTVVAPPSISEGFNSASIPLNGTSMLTFTISNSNSSTTLSGIGFTDTLPTGLVVTVPNGLTNSCGGAASATAGGTSISLTGVSLVSASPALRAGPNPAAIVRPRDASSASSCTVVVNVTGTRAGAFQNNTSAVTSNEGGNGSGATATLNVGSNAPSPSITTTSLPSGVIGQSYSALILATGGAGNYTFSATGLPAGLTISASGQISGTPTRPGTFTFTAEATDQNSATASATFTIIISASTLSFSATFPVGIVGIDYPLQILTATGGVAPYTFAIKSGSGTLPPGLTFSGPQFSGIPTTAGYYAFTIVVTDSAGNSVSTPATITINPAHADLVISQSSVSFTLTVGSGGLPTPASDTVGSSDVTQLLNYSVAESPVVSWLDINGGGTTPGSVGLVLDPSALTLGAGTYQTTVNVACNAPSPCAGKMHPIQVTLTVNAQAPQLSATSQLVSFQTVASNTATLSQPLGIENSGGGTLAISSITPGASWITVSGAPSILQAGKPVSITVTANPAGLSPNYYSSSIAINSSAGSLTAPVTLEIAPNLTMSLAPGGTQFSAPAGSFPGNSAGSFLVTAAGNGTVSWNASVTAGANFLNLSTTTGTSTAASPGSVSFSLNSAAVAGLAVGAYYGTIHVTSGSVADSPLDFGVVLNITSVNATVRPNPSPAGLIFTSSTGPSQSVLVFASSSAELSYQASAETPAGQTWLSVSPGTGTASSASPGQSTVTVNPASLTPGMYRGSVSYAFSSAVVSTVNVTMTITGSGTVTSSIAPAPRASGCTPANLVPTQTGLISNFQQPAGWPVPLTVTLIDDCGTAVTNGQVIATFSNGDPPLTLAAIDASSGIYTGTWTPSGVAPQATITSTATAGTFPSASTRITGEVSANTPPLLNPNGVLHVFNPAIGGALAPGTILQIYGSNLAAQAVTAQAIPLPTSPGGTSVLIGGVAVPLYYVSPGQINAELPFEAVPGSQLQVQVNANGALSTPGTIQVTQAEPGIATLASGQAIAQHADYSLVSAASPAKPGEILMIYLAGLGATDNAVATGAAAPLSPLSRALIPPTVTVNGVNATVSFAGLTPTTVGLYQIDFQVPATTQNGQAGVVVSQSGVTSNTAILPVQQ